MLLKLRDFIKREKIVSLQQLARNFNLDTQALAPMLAIWQKKGVIVAYEQAGGCQSSCLRCDQKSEALALVKYNL